MEKGVEKAEKEEGKVKAQIDSDWATTGTDYRKHSEAERVRHMLFTENIQYASVYGTNRFLSRTLTFICRNTDISFL